MGSSSTSTEASVSSARARTSRCRCPPRADGPCSPTYVSKPSGGLGPSARAERDPGRALNLGVARFGPREADVLANARRKQVGVLTGDGDRPAQVVLPVVRRSLAERDPAPLGVEEGEEQIHDSRLARSTGPQQCDPAPGFEAEAEAVHVRLAGRVPSTDVVERHAERRQGDGDGLGGVDHGGLPIDQLQYPRAGAERRRQLTGHRRPAAAPPRRRQARAGRASR